MRAFLVELGYFLGTLWSRTWRWALRRKVNLAITSASVLALLIIWGMAIQGNGPQATAHLNSTPTPVPTPTQAYTEVVATPVGGGESTPLPVPSSPPADMSAAESIARDWATAYLGRSSADDTAWKELISAYTIPSVVQQLDGQAFRAQGVLYGLAPTTVTDITIKPPPADGETNTPIRWSRTVAVSVQTRVGSTVTIEFAVVLMKEAGGWKVTSVEEMKVEE